MLAHQEWTLDFVALEISSASFSFKDNQYPQKRQHVASDDGVSSDGWIKLPGFVTLVLDDDAASLPVPAHDLCTGMGATTYPAPPPIRSRSAMPRARMCFTSTATISTVSNPSSAEA